MAQSPIQNIFARKRKAHPQAAQPFVYIGTDTINSPGKGVYLARFNPATGQLSTPQLAAETVRPSFMAASTLGKRHILYTANEGQEEHSSGISSFLIDATTGAPKPLNKVSAGGPGPCYVSVDATSTSAFCANYTGSSVASFKVNSDGSLSEPVDRLNFKLPTFGHHGPNSARQDAPHPHSAQISPDNRFLVVNDLGNDNIVTFFIHADTAQLGPPQLNACRVPGSGPRHVAFHPNQRWVYGINELSSTLQQYLWTATHAAAPVALLTEAGPTVSTVDPDFREPNTAAEVALTPEGDFLLCSNRGENSLAVFRVNATSGALTLVQRVSCAGKTPRMFTLDPTGKWLLCGNQDSSTITVFALNPATGQLTGPVQTLPVPMPQMILFA